MTDFSQTNIDLIFVPQGSEYQAIRRGVGKREKPISVLGIPMGYDAASLFFQNWLQSTDFSQKSPRHVLLMGLAGGLSSIYQVGDLVIYEQCGRMMENHQVVWRNCDLIESKTAHLVKGWTSDRIICSILDKQNLYQTYGVEVVDMEGFAMLEILQPMGIQASILRVISDQALHNLPNLEGTISPEGTLQPLPLAWKMLQQPIASIRLIQGSLKGLNVLEQVAQQIKSQNS